MRGLLDERSFRWELENDGHLEMHRSIILFCYKASIIENLNFCIPVNPTEFIGFIKNKKKDAFYVNL